MEIDEELGRLSRVYGEPIEKVKERFEEAKKEIQTEAPQADPETVKTRASEIRKDSF